MSTEYEVIKPYVCDSKLCAYQYYNLNRGPSLEVRSLPLHIHSNLPGRQYEICHNTQTVDLLVSLAYCAAVEGVLDEPLPIGLGLRVPIPAASSLPQGPINHRVSDIPWTFTPPTGEDGLCDFDRLDKRSVSFSVLGDRAD
jgi:ubiquitin-conjugating enzyme E2 Q